MANTGRHDRSRRKLMGRTDIDQADIASLQFIDLKETVLDRDGNDGIAAVAKDFPPQSEPRFFNADAVVFIAQQVRQYAQQRNRAGTDDDLGRRCMNAARFVNIPAQGTAQVRHSLVVIGR